MKFYITTPIYYINGAPSIGHAYTTIAADVFMRYHRLKGEEVFFLTGTDENSQKNLEAAQKAGKEQNVQGYLDEMAQEWKQTFDVLDIGYTRFVRTTELDHQKAVEKFWHAVNQKGDMYSGVYEGLYCKGCEAFVTETDLVDGTCPIHKTIPETIKEQNYFFRLTNYRQALLDHIATHPDFVQPVSRRNEIVNYIKDFMTDISISRSTMKWGIPVPTDPTQRIYVWFDALINYLTGVGYAMDDGQFQKWWPADVQLVGKDILKFHCALWPAMLISAELPLPKRVFAHGYFTVDGEKMSKSLGNVIDPLEITREYSNDVLRYFLMREIRFGEDGDFSRERLRKRYDADLANEFGNLVHRTLTMTEKYCEGLIPSKVENTLPDIASAYQNAMETLEPHEALEHVWLLIRACNQFIDQKKPWELAKKSMEETRAVLYVLLENLRLLAWFLYPFLGETSEQLFKKLGVKTDEEMKQHFDQALMWGGLKEGGKIDKAEPLFPKRV